MLQHGNKVYEINVWYIDLTGVLGAKPPEAPEWLCKHTLNFNWLYLWNRLTDFDALTFGRKLLLSTFILTP